MADILNYDDLLREFKKIAKRADQRLVRLEQTGKQEGTAYRSAMRKISAFTPGGKRFNVKPPKTIRGLRSKMSAVREFLAAESSTVTGQKNISKRIRNTIKDRYGLDIKNDDQLRAVFEGGLWSKLNEMFGSDTAVKLIASVQKKNGNIKAAIEEQMEKHYTSPSEGRQTEDVMNEWKDARGLEFIFDGNK